MKKTELVLFYQINQKMITENCLVGCSEINHHKSCDNFIIVNFDCEPSVYTVENSIFLNSELEKIIVKFNIRASKHISKRSEKWKRFYFSNYCIEKLNMFDYQVFYMVGVSKERLNYSIEKHNELKKDKIYIEKTLDIANDLNLIKRI